MPVVWNVSEMKSIAKKNMKIKTSGNKNAQCARALLQKNGEGQLEDTSTGHRWKMLHSGICTSTSVSDVESMIKQTSNPSVVPSSCNPRAPGVLSWTSFALAPLPPSAHALQTRRDRSTSVLENINWQHPPGWWHPLPAAASWWAIASIESVDTYIFPPLRLQLVLWHIPSKFFVQDLPGHISMLVILICK